MLLTNGRIYTLDEANPVVDTLVVRDGRIAFAGRRADVNVAAAEEAIDLGGRAALPGLVDAHGHLMHLARARLSLDAGGSDFPVESPSPFHGIYASVARRPQSGAERGWQPEQRMTRAEAVRSFTTWNAYASRQEHSLGSLAVGKLADLVVLSDDVFACPEVRMAQIAPVFTLVGGEVVYRLSSP